MPTPTPPPPIHRPRPRLSNEALFAALIAAQATHSIEEYTGRLWETFPPARIVSGLLTDDLRLGFGTFNIALVLFGVWCYLWPVRRGWRSAALLMNVWGVIELLNGLGHPTWSIIQGGYTPGVATAPILFVLALLLLRRLASVPI